MLMLILLCMLNFAISWWNARVCGMFWLESEMVGGRFLLWCGAIMSAVGFSSVYLPVLLLTVAATLGEPGQAEQLVKFGMSFWYVLVIVPVLGTGLAITVHSWIEAYRNRSMLSVGVAAYNTFAQVHNTWGAVQHGGEALGTVFQGFGDLFKGDGNSDSAKGKVVLLGVIIVVVAILAGVLTTVAVMRKYMGTLPMPALATNRRAA